MKLAGFTRVVRPVPAVAAAAALVALPAIAFGAIGFGGMHGGMHFGGARHGLAHPAAPPAIDAPAAKPPFVTAPPPMRVRTALIGRRDGVFFRFRDARFHDRFGRGRFGGRRLWALGGPWGWGGYWGDDGGYGGGPAYAPREEAEAEAPTTCAELLTWQPKLGRATRQSLCDEAPADIRG